MHRKKQQNLQVLWGYCQGEKEKLSTIKSESCSIQCQFVSTNVFESHALKVNATSKLGCLLD